MPSDSANRPRRATDVLRLQPLLFFFAEGPHRRLPYGLRSILARPARQLCRDLGMVVVSLRHGGCRKLAGMTGTRLAANDQARVWVA